MPNLLWGEAIADLLTWLEQTDTLVDGKTTAGWHAKTVKSNQQLDPQYPATAAMID